MQILVIEDDKRISDFLIKGLEENGHLVTLCKDAETVLDEFLTIQFDLIICDIMLPKMDGIQLVQTLRYKKIFTPILMLSALNTVQDKIYNAEFVNAAAWLISKKCIDTVGGFNPSFFHYAEDNNYIQRLKFHNINVGVVPNAIVFHDRAKRVENIFFEDIKIIYRREIISKISDPFVEYSFYAEYWKICRTIIKSFFSLSINELKVSCSKIIILNGLNKSQVVKNRIESKKVQPSFLE